MQISQALHMATRWRANLAKTYRVARNLGRHNNRVALARDMAASAQDSVRRDATHLQDHGYAALCYEYAGTAQTISACRDIIAEREASAARTGKAFFAQLISPSDFAKYPALLQTALDERVLQTLAASYGQLPYLESVELLVSYPTGKPELMQSQLWHCDETDTMVVKQLIYIEDVGDAEGPFTLIPPKESTRVSSLSAHYLRDNEIDQMLDINKAVTLAGPSGSRYLVDTGRCYHFGSRAAKTRYALFFYYNTGYGKYPRLSNWRGTAAEVMTWSDLQRAALDLGG